MTQLIVPLQIKLTTETGCYDTKHTWRGEVVMMVVVACLGCLVFGGCAGFFFGALCTNASDKGELIPN
jgi:hypothetical protein